MITNFFLVRRCFLKSPCKVTVWRETLVMLGSVPQSPVLSTKSIWDEMRDGEVDKCEIGCMCYISKWSRNSFKRYRRIFVCVRLLTCQPVLDFSLVQQTRMRRHLRIKLPEWIVKWAILRKYFEKDSLIFFVISSIKKPKKQHLSTVWFWSSPNESTF